MPKTFAEALRLAADQQETIERQSLQIEEMKPKIELIDAVFESEETFDMQEVSGMLDVLNMGRNNLISFLKKEGIIMSSNMPYRSYIEKGMMKIAMSPNKKNIYARKPKTVAFGKGVKYIKDLLIRRGHVIGSAKDKEKNKKALMSIREKLNSQ